MPAQGAPHDNPSDTPATMSETTPTPEHADAGAETSPLTLEQQLAELQAKHTEVSDAYLRAKAEAENIRRRAEEEISKARKFAVESFAESLLPVRDSLEAALATHTAKPDTPVETVMEGVNATLRQLAAALERNKVIELNPAAGTKFDPNIHQAISVVPAEQEANTVVGVLQKGYLIADRVLRPALVTVAAPK
ncbi:MAG: nucleotide exchange factor GrpE [Aquabacterium commune]|uniref:nucleotide exchange factor GrpE n=1 Tax=Aquabacterium TaxID=92793 RepID=UPI0025C3DDF8|nr:nucleotide exchange factor GrpE [Aquabacterium sp.]|tara:strand:- start:653 stop:1231 length:579 start_codon:yes stop_codon:yes gene_type:complete